MRAREKRHAAPTELNGYVCWGSKNMSRQRRWGRNSRRKHFNNSYRFRRRAKKIVNRCRTHILSAASLVQFRPNVFIPVPFCFGFDFGSDRLCRHHRSLGCATCTKPIRARVPFPPPRPCLLHSRLARHLEPRHGRDCATSRCRAGRSSYVACEPRVDEARVLCQNGTRGRPLVGTTHSGRPFHRSRRSSSRGKTTEPRECSG